MNVSPQQSSTTLTKLYSASSSSPGGTQVSCLQSPGPPPSWTCLVDIWMNQRRGCRVNSEQRTLIYGSSLSRQFVLLVVNIFPHSWCLFFKKSISDNASALVLWDPGWYDTVNWNWLKNSDNRPGESSVVWLSECKPGSYGRSRPQTDESL